MKKPDKIYLNKLMIRPGMLHPAQFPLDETEEVYIRKDALLEWAKENQEKCFSVVEDDLWQEVIDKINEI